MKLLLATRNRGKIREFEQLFAGLPVTIATFDQVALPAVEEDGDSFEQNAAKKALEVARATRMLVLSDDSGLEVDALGGRPGVHSARFAGPNASDADNNQKLVRELASLAGAELSARFRVVLALADLDGPLGEHVHFERAACEGRIRLTPSGHDGFGYDPYFVPHGFDCSLAELSAEEKNRISHRAKASAQLRVFLERYLATRPRTDRAR